MAQITNAQLLTALQSLEGRVGKMEIRMDKYEAAINAFNDRMSDIEVNIKTGRVIIGFISAICSPLITATLVLIIQHNFH